ncbi:MAG: hypothetical protein HY430_03175 [Candidatus Levybacteria bacterium]|nr:hypothetical protein [Candidatus Levybacteria bacterium]
MQKTILQVPLNQQLKSDAERVALSQGFSSLQEVVRVFLTKLATQKIEVSLQESVPLSEENEMRYLQLTRDFQKGKNVYSAKNADDLIKQLNESSVS